LIREDHFSGLEEELVTIVYKFELLLNEENAGKEEFEFDSC